MSSCAEVKSLGGCAEEDVCKACCVTCAGEPCVPAGDGGNARIRPLFVGGVGGSGGSLGGTTVGVAFGSGLSLFGKGFSSFTEWTGNLFTSWG